MLHLVFQSPISEALLERVASGDDLVFMESAVLGLLQRGRLSKPLSRLLANNGLFVLTDDLASRGIAAEELVRGICVTDYSGLVALTVKHPVTHSWF